MKTVPTRVVLASAVLLAASALIAPPATSDGPHRKHPHAHPPASTESSQVVLDWQRIAIATVFPTTPVPSGQPLLGFTSLAVHDAVHASLRRTTSSETAAVAAAAHDVLVHYFPAAKGVLDGHRTTTLSGVPDGEAEDTGVRIGQRAALRMIESRSGDGYGDPDILYTLPPGVGTWQPVAPAVMLAPWLGSLRPLVLHRPVRVDGPDTLTSADYTTDYTEVKLLGSATSALRTPYQTETALFFNTNPAIMLGDALIRRLEDSPESLEATADLFAAIHGAVADSAIRCWQLKRDVGFWRPIEAIARAAEDRNPDTAPQAGWAPLLPTPPYSDYVSGHGCFTGATVAVIRATFGDDVPLELRSISLTGAVRPYTTLSHLEFDALHSRIWGGLHFRDAMSDAYQIGRETARRVMLELQHRH
jgi:hypothetical protein